jgi:hypothetical protein
VGVRQEARQALVGTEETWHATAMTGPNAGVEWQPAIVPSVDVVDESFIRAQPQVVAATVAQRWHSWWPNLTLQIYMDRGLQGMRWTVTGELVGSSEIWLEEHPPGVIVHYFLRADPTVPGAPTTMRAAATTRRAQAQLQAVRRRHVLAWKRVIWALKDELEAHARSYR